MTPVEHKTPQPASGSRTAAPPAAELVHAGLRFAHDDEPGIARRRHGAKFRYVDAAGAPVRDAAALARIRSLAIPPAYEDVWICADAGGHLQATGRDARGRKQYRYHEKFRALRDSGKYEHLAAFADALPAIRARVDHDLARHGLPREKVLALVVRLLETTMIRVGNEDYARANKSYGLTTLHTRHVDIHGAELRFHFKGKSGKQWRLALKDRRVARIMRGVHDLPGQHLFQYVDADGARHDVTSREVNAYLREISGADITAKDFRTWHGTVLAAIALGELGAATSATHARRQLRAAVGQVAERLGNTVSVCRKCYIHPRVIDRYVEQGPLIVAEDAAAAPAAALSGVEQVVAELLREAA